MENKNIKNIVNLTNRLTSLCEGFDITNKSAIISSKIKVLLTINQHKKISPTMLKNKVCLAKSNLANLCKTLISEGLILKTKDDFDSRIIFYELTSKGENYLNSVLEKMEFNFVNEIAYKKNLTEIFNTVAYLLSLIS